MGAAAKSPPTIVGEVKTTGAVFGWHWAIEAFVKSTGVVNVHALVTPGVLFDQTEAFRSAAFLSLPGAVLVSSPLLLPRTAFGRWAARRWRDWTLVSLVGAFLLASVLVFFPDAIVTPDSGSAVTILITRIEEHDWRSGGLLLVLYGGFFLVLL